MRFAFLLSVICLALNGFGCNDDNGPPLLVPPGGVPSAPSLPPPTLPFPSINVGEVVRFQFTADGWVCVGDGRCRSYNVTAPSDGTLRVEVSSASGDGSFVSTMEMYIVPGADFWDVGPGPRISATVPRAVKGQTYEIRMYSSTVSSVELELLASLNAS
jgi:hypothetical protein